MTRARVVWRIPDTIHEECPLPEPWYWQDEDTDVFAALKNPDEGPFAWVSGFTNEDTVLARFRDGDRDVVFPRNEKEQALRYIYAQFLFNGPTT